MDNKQVDNKQKKQKKVKPVTAGRVFAKFFIITFLICIVVFTSGVGIFATVLDQKPMDKSNDTVRPVAQTEEKIDILIPAEGIFATDYADSKRVNMLLLGTTDEGLTDTIMLASFDPEAKRVDVISVPRDTYYERKGYSGGFLKINSVFHQGPQEMALAIHNILLGIPINYYAVLDYEGVKQIVDSMGGVPMDVPQRMYYSSPEQHLLIDLQPGEQVLDGDHAVQYLRFRKGYANGDIGRVEAQQQFMKNAAARALSLKLPKVAKTAVENIDSSISLRAILYLATKANGMDSANVATYMLPGTNANIGGLSFWARSEDQEIEEMLRIIYDGPQEIEATDEEAGATDAKE